MSDSSGRWEYLALRSLDGNTELRPECPALTLAVLTLAETRRPQVRAASRQGSARKRRSGTPLVQREARSCKAREKTIHHGHSFLTHPPPSPSDSPGGAGLRASDLFTAIFDFRLVELAWDNANNRTGSSNHEKPHNSNAGQVRSDPVSASGAVVISRLQFTTGAGHRRGRVRQTRPMRSRRPPCHRRQRSRRALLPQG